MVQVLLRRFAKHEELGAAASPENGASACCDHEGFSLGGPGAGLSFYTGVSVTASVCMFKELK